jgi:hypothetical protein
LIRILPSSPILEGVPESVRLPSTLPDVSEISGTNVSSISNGKFLKSAFPIMFPGFTRWSTAVE